MKKLKMLAFALPLFIAPCLCANDGVKDENVHKAWRAKSLLDIETNKNDPIKKRDFAGDFILSIESVGGVVAPSVIVPFGVSISLIGQVTFNDKGQGVLNYGNVVAYDGDGSTAVDVVSIPPGTVTLTIDIIDSKLGTGTITFADPSVVFSGVASFVIVKTKNGLVFRVIGQVTSTSDSLTGAVLDVNLRRQIL